MDLPTRLVLTRAVKDALNGKRAQTTGAVSRAVAISRQALDNIKYGHTEACTGDVLVTLTDYFDIDRAKVKIPKEFQ